MAPPIEVVLLDEIAGRLDDVTTRLDKLDILNETMAGVKKRLDEQVPKALQGQAEKTVTDEVGSFSPPEPWFSADLSNEGNQTVYYSINDPTREFIPLEKGRKRTVSLSRALIKTIYFRCDGGETSTLRIIGAF